MKNSLNGILFKENSRYGILIATVEIYSKYPIMGRGGLWGPSPPRGPALGGSLGGGPGGVALGASRGG